MDALYPTNEVGHTGYFIAENIPEELRQRNQWVVHKDREPYTPNTNRRASSTDLMTWRSFEEATIALDTGQFDGAGFVFSSADPYTGIDLDGCRDPETGEIGPEGQEIIDALDGYTEVSPSGTGVHIIVRGKLERGRKRGWIEAYSCERYFTMTGRAL
jgi:putative DNA primase/helicase